MAAGAQIGPTYRSEAHLDGIFVLPIAPPRELLSVSLERNVARYTEGSCLVKFDITRALCTASLEGKLPAWGVIFRVIPWIGLDFLDVARALDAFASPARAAPKCFSDVIYG